MGALYTVKVEQLKGRTVELAVTQIHPDAGPFPKHPQFALRLLMDKAYDLDDDLDFSPTGALGEAIPEDNVWDEDWMEAHSPEFVATVELLDSSDSAINEEQVLQQLKARGPASEADLQQRYQAFWRDRSQLPRAHYSIAVTDAAYLDHLRARQEWNSAAY